jgi:hypothetical protein
MSRSLGEQPRWRGRRKKRRSKRNKRERNEAVGKCLGVGRFEIEGQGERKNKIKCPRGRYPKKIKFPRGSSSKSGHILNWCTGECRWFTQALIMLLQYKIVNVGWAFVFHIIHDIVTNFICYNVPNNNMEGIKVSI